MVHEILDGFNKWYTVTANVQKKPMASTLSMTFNHLSVATMSFQDAADDAAIKFSKLHSNIYIGLSGGADSEFVADVFLRNNIPFTAIVATTPHSLEYLFALEWCNRNKVEPVFLEFARNDTRLLSISFLASKAIKQKCNIVTVTMYLAKYAHERAGVLVTGESPLFGHTKGHEASGDILDLHSVVFYPMLYDAMLPICSFLMYTPELFLAMATEGDTSINHNAAKSRLYNVPFRVKDCNPVMVIADDIETKLHTLLSISEYCPLPEIAWNKNDLIELLTK